MRFSYGFFTLAAAVAASASSLVAEVIDFSELSYAGSASWYNGSDGAGQYASKGVVYPNSYNSSFGSWAGWGYSKVNAPTDGTWMTGQYASYAGPGVGGSGNYAVAYQDAFVPMTPTLTLPVATSVSGAYITNVAYAALDMANGSAFSKKFGGASGSDPDWFKLTITGKDGLGTLTGTVDFYLADFRFADSGSDYIVNSWQWVDLSALGGSVKTVTFELSSSDVGSFGINTPTYFAMDNLTVAAVPEPASAGVVALATLLPLARRRRSK